MNSLDYLTYLVEEIHTTVVATVDDNELPVTAAIDMMDADEKGLYFLTAKGKGFYDRLKQRGYLALTGMKGEDTMHCAAISIRGWVEGLGDGLLPRLFEKNPYMNEIYPTPQSRQALTVFRLYEASGEWFDLSPKLHRLCRRQGGHPSGKLPALRQLHGCLSRWGGGSGGMTMTQAERRRYLIGELLRECPEQAGCPIPSEEDAQRKLLRSLLNLRMPGPLSSDLLAVQDAYLQEETRRKGITRLADLTPVQEDICLWRGDITTLECDAIVNAANSAMLGCFCPCHGCIDNAIHTYAGIQLRLECAALMERQGREERTGGAKLTAAYNLPCKYVLHTVGPVISGPVTGQDEALLASCYRSCLELATEKGLTSIAFCCISTGEFRFPNRQAAEIAIRTVTQYQKKTNHRIKVIFNVFQDADYRIYRELLPKGPASAAGAG
jgi:O-acetyl-ADP-ribose deacetylase (regulator of RNase III)/uncharacterized pyridoxamine 5'-phosphate oxidase family protein